MFFSGKSFVLNKILKKYPQCPLEFRLSHWPPDLPSHLQQPHWFQIHWWEFHFPSPLLQARRLSRSENYHILNSFIYANFRDLLFFTKQNFLLLVHEKYSRPFSDPSDFSAAWRRPFSRRHGPSSRQTACRRTKLKDIEDDPENSRIFEISTSFSLKCETSTGIETRKHKNNEVF